MSFYRVRSKARSSNLQYNLPTKDNVYDHFDTTLPLFIPIQSLDQFGQVYTNLYKFRKIWTSLDQFKLTAHFPTTPLSMPIQSLDQLGQVYTILDKFRLIWTSLD